MNRRRFALVRLVLTAAVVLLAAVVWQQPAAAYPQWQLASGATRCNQCHYAPAGGGLLTSYGRDAAGEELSTFGGDGALLHGAVRPPRWLAVGGDLRGAFVANGVQDPGGATVAAFPMQADLRVRVGFGGGVSLSATGGVRGQVRDAEAATPGTGYEPVSQSRLVSREHYLMWQPESVGPYLRAGRFYAPYGLRMSEHVLYVARDLGFDFQQETYNLSGGWIAAGWELHATAFAPDFVRHMGSRASGGAAYGERRLLADRLALALQARVAFEPGVTRAMGGAVAKLYIEPLRTLLLGEADLVRLSFDAADTPARGQLVGTAGFALLPATGVVATFLVERSQLDLHVADAWTAGTALLSWFPYAHLEVQAMGRLQFPSGEPSAKTFFAQLHYYL